MPGHSTAPRVGSLNPAMMRSAVDLPQPDGPSRVRNSPARTVRSKPSRPTTPLQKVLPPPRSATRPPDPAVARSAFVEGRSVTVAWPFVTQPLLNRDGAARHSD